MPDMNGYVAMNSLGMQGAWYAYGDSWGSNAAPPGDCQTKGGFTNTQCSSITFPPPFMPSDAGGDAAAANTFPQTTAGEMCLTGTAAKVIPKSGSSAADYSDIFGIGIGLDFNNVGGVKMPYKAKTNNVIGFKFHLTGVPTGGIRVEFPIMATDASGDSYALPATVVKADGDYTADMTTTATDPHPLSPSFTLSTGTEPPFDPDGIESIQFHVVTNTTAAITVAKMCVSNLVAVVKTP
jgi:hypothetical protein